MFLTTLCLLFDRSQIVDNRIFLLQIERVDLECRERQRLEHINAANSDRMTNSVCQRGLHAAQTVELAHVRVLE